MGKLDWRERFLRMESTLQNMWLRSRVYCRLGWTANIFMLVLSRSHKVLILICVHIWELP